MVEESKAEMLSDQVMITQQKVAEMRYKPGSRALAL